MSKLISILCAALLACTGTSCAQTTKPKTEKESINKKKVLVAYFSRADENYSVGYINEGNTEKVAKEIVAQTGADIFHIETVKPYPAEYDLCIEEAKKELQANARPEIKGDINIDDYDIIFIGYPNWWGEPPMAVYTFIEKHDWNGKTVIPFITHEGSGFGGTDKKIVKACKGANSKPGYAVYGHIAQREPTTIKTQVAEWLAK